MGGLVMAEAWAAKFYNSKEWRQLRQALIIQRGAICQQCGRNMTFNQSELIGHHTPGNINDPLVSLNPENVDLICFDCHNKEHGRYGYTKERHVFLVYGAPCSGKSTLIKQMAVRGDIIVNMDLLYKAISGLELYDKPDNIKQNVLRVHDLLIDHVAQRYGKWNNAYIEGGYPLKAVREHIINRTGAEPIYCRSTIDECMGMADSRGIFADEWKGYIKKWYAMYQE